MSIKRIEFIDGPPLYMKEVKAPDAVVDMRFSIESLQSLYR